MADSAPYEGGEIVLVGPPDEEVWSVVRWWSCFQSIYHGPATDMTPVKDEVVTTVEARDAAGRAVTFTIKLRRDRRDSPGDSAPQSQPPGVPDVPGGRTVS